MSSSRVLYAGTVFCGAFLLFLVEPMAARQLLPALGGSSAVWIACLFFFQAMLLAGYAYAHWLLSQVRNGRIAPMHIALLGIAALSLALPFHPDLRHGTMHPASTILLSLGATIGLPFLLLSATSPLAQVVWARTERQPVPYRLFALSNFGSLLALLAYPLLVEPYLTLHTQIRAWSIGFCLYAVLCSALVLRLRHIAKVEAATTNAVSIPNPSKRRASWARRIAPERRALWFLLPLGGALQLCAVTSHLTQNIAAIPLLWVVPLAVYLLSFIFAFEFPWLYNRGLVVRLLAVLLASLGYMLTKADASLPIVISIPFYLLELFVACWFCHAELYALRPDAATSSSAANDENATAATAFYLLLAGGGAAGTFFIGIASPLLFRSNYDLPLAFTAVAALAFAATWREGWSQRLLWSVGVALACVLLGMLHIAYARNSLVNLRNFYGALRVQQSHVPPQALTARTLLNGSIQHGTQWFAPGFRTTPTTYYAEDSGVGLAIRNCCGARPRRIGVIGLGAGTLAAYGRRADRIEFYEINPLVERLARALFTYIRDTPAQVTVIPGDARLSLAAEAPQHFDVLVVDAFSGDAIPVHLLTAEAMALYRRHLTPGGVLAFHISNQYLDLAPVVGRLAAHAGLEARRVHSMRNEERGEFTADWILVGNNPDLFHVPEFANAADLVALKANVQLWTDDYSSVLPVLRWHSEK